LPQGAQHNHIQSRWNLALESTAKLHHYRTWADLCGVLYWAGLPAAEKALIARIRKAAGRTPLPAVGIGDDCAVLNLPRGHEALLTTDFSLEGVHFRRDWHSPESIGYRCLARGLSDIAAMGGEPRAAFLSLALPPQLPQSWVDRFLQSLLRLARKFETALAGGDTAESPGGVLADIVVLGSVPRGRAVLRSGARPGDRIFVTGQVGGSAAALDLLLCNPRKELQETELQAHFFPLPRIAVGRFVRQKRLVSAMIDLSDGLSTDLAHICEQSGVGAEVFQTAIPRASIGKTRAQVDLQFALHGGEDYELLFTAPPSRRVPSLIEDVPVTEIGKITRSKRLTLRNNSGKATRLDPHGWEHFRPQKPRVT
jgi:thiamine-monophosphate kinase